MVWPYRPTQVLLNCAFFLIVLLCVSLRQVHMAKEWQDGICKLQFQCQSADMLTPHEANLHHSITKNLPQRLP